MLVGCRPGRPGSYDEPDYVIDLEEHAKLLRDWRRRADHSQQEHADAAWHLSRSSMLVGIPTIIVTSVVGSAVFISLSRTTETVGVLPRVVIMVLSFSATILSALQTFLGFNTAAMQHQEYWAQYEAIIRRIDDLLADMPLKRDAVTSHVSAEFHHRVVEIALALDEIDTAAPTLSPRIVRRVNRYRRRASRRRRRKAWWRRVKAWWHRIRTGPEPTDGATPHGSESGSGQPPGSTDTTTVA